MKNKILIFAAPFLLLIYASCNKISESIERDIVVYDTTEFNIGILNSIDTAISTTITNIPASANIESEITRQAQGFSPANIRSVKLNGIGIALMPVARDSIDQENNFGNLRELRFGITADGKTDNMGLTSISSTGIVSTLVLPASITPDKIQSSLNNPSKSYTVRVKAKKVTTKIMETIAVVSYTVTLAK